MHLLRYHSESVTGGIQVRCPNSVRHRFPGNSEILPFVPVQSDEDEQHGREAPHGGAAVAEEREGDADDRHESDGHADVYEQVHEYAARDAVSVYPGESLPASLCVVYDSPDEEYIKKYHYS